MTTKEVVAWLKQAGSKATLDGMARYGIEAKLAYGVPMGSLLKLSKELGTDHTLSLSLWETGCYEARLLASLIGDPKQVTRAQMNAWAKDFENWGDCDTVCFKLFDRSPHAWEMVEPWARSPREFVKRGGYVLLACLALHDKKATDEQFLAFLPLIEEGAQDDRNFVKKGVNWALRSMGERGPLVRDAVGTLAQRLSRSDSPAPRWVGADALRQLANRPALKKNKTAKRTGKTKVTAVSHKTSAPQTRKSSKR